MRNGGVWGERAVNRQSEGGNWRSERTKVGGRMVIGDSEGEREWKLCIWLWREDFDGVSIHCFLLHE